MSLELSGTNKIVNDNLNTEVKTLFTPKNWIINGGFDVWQRGTSQTIEGYGSDDRWNNYHITSIKTHTRQAFTVGQTDVPNNPKYFSRTVVTTAGTAGSLVVKQQPIEDVTKLADKTVSLSFWAKADSNKDIAIAFNQDFGTGGSTPISGIGSQKISLTTSWQRFTVIVALPSISGKTIGTDNKMILQFWLDAGSNFSAQSSSLGNQSGTFDIANVSLVEGSVPVEWQTEAYADVLDKCNRYCYDSLGNSSENSVAYSHIGFGMCGTTSIAHIPVMLPKNFRKVPTSLIYSGNLVINWIDNATTATVIAIDGGRSSAKIVNLNVTTAAVLTVYRPVFFMRFNDSTAKLLIEAEL